MSWLSDLFSKIQPVKAASPAPTPPEAPKPAPKPEVVWERPKTPRKTNQAGINLIKSSEGLRLQAYPDPGTGGDPWTIGYGDTGPDVKPGLVITESEAEARLRGKLAKFEKDVEDSVTVPLSDNQFAALVSFCYNCGPGNLKSSTLLKKLNQKDYAGAADQFQVWVKAAGKVLPGLVARREKEKTLFLTV